MANKKTEWLVAPLIVTLFISSFFTPQGHAQVTLTVGEGSGLPGSLENPVTVSLNNPANDVGSIQVEVCDEDDYLTPVLDDGTMSGYKNCDTINRASVFRCAVNELGNGCCRVMLFSTDPSNSFIGKGTGDIFTLKYDVSGEAPGGECKDLTLENVIVPNELGRDLDVTAEPGEFCFLTATTTAPISTTTTTASTSTTTMPSSCKVSVSPLAVTIRSGATAQFSAETSCGEGAYTWQIVPESTIGSTLDQDGLFTAGDNTTATDIEETVRVTDTAHGNESATATVTVQVKEEPPIECEVAINPSSATVYSGDTVTLEAHTSGVECAPGNYEWSISSDIGSMIEDGAYTAGNNDTGSQATDVITVVDHANSDISGTAHIYVEGEGTDKQVNIIPRTLLGCRCISLPYVLLAWSKDAHFDSSSTISFEPGDDISELCQVGCGKIFLALVLLGADAQEGPVTVTISAGEEVVTGEIKVELIFPLAEGYSGSAGTYREISFDTL